MADKQAKSGRSVRRRKTPLSRDQVLQRAVRLADALAELPEAQRDALVLQHWHGLSLSEIGERLGRSRAAVAGLLKRGLKQLRVLLPDQE